MPKTLHVHPHGYGYGWRRGLPTHRFPRRFAHVEAAALPPMVDLRAQCPAVYDQSTLGSCTSHAWAGLVEFLQMKQGLNDYVPSRLFIYYNERAMEGDTADDTGASLSDGAHVVNTQGAPHEDLWPYDINKFSDQPTPDVYADGTAHLTFDVQQVAQDLTSMKDPLANGLPIAIGFTVYESFESDAVARSGIVPLPGTNEAVLGGHAVLVVGYDDAKSWFIVRNSWGSGWGAEGYFYMPYAYLTNPRLADDFWIATRTE